MQNQNTFTSLSAATEKALKMGGVGLLGNAYRFKSYVSDLADKSLPEVRLLSQLTDAELLKFLEPLTRITDASGQSDLRTAATRIEQFLEDERFVEQGLASKASSELVSGVASYWGLSYVGFAPSNAQRSAAVNSTVIATNPTPNASQRFTASNAPRTPTANPPQATNAATYQPPAPVPTQLPLSPQATAQPPAKSKSKARYVVVFLLMALLGTAAGVTAYLFASNGSLPFDNTSDQPANVQPDYIDKHSVPHIQEAEDVQTLDQTENDLKQTWILYSNTDDNSTTSILYLTNLSSSYKDVELDFRFFDKNKNDMGSVRENVVSLGPNETTCVHASSNSGAVDGTYYYTVYDARTPNAISLGECVTHSIESKSSRELTIKLTNSGSTNVHVSKAFVFGTGSDGAAQWSSTTWYDDTGNEQPGVIAPGQSTEITFEGGLWDSMDVDVFPIGYADAS